jgi:Iron-containing redox enzyme
MNSMNTLLAEFQDILAKFNGSQPIRRIMAGDVTIDHYKEILRQIFHHTRENPQIQALATVYFRGHQRTIIKDFYRHATSEIGHDQLALNDLKVLGEDVGSIPYENPLPSTTALLGFAFYQINNLNPIGYLGYLFFLEFTPTQNGRAYMELLNKIGVPYEAMTFLQDHAAVDIGHNKLMESYVAELIKTEDDLSSVIYAMQVTGKLYADMLQGAFDQVDNPKLRSVSSAERRIAE